MLTTAHRLADVAYKAVMYRLRTSIKNKHLTAFLRYNSAAKFANLLSVEAAIRRGETRDFGFPYMLTVEPTNRCNLHCPLCPTGKGLVGRDKQNLELEAFRRIIDEIGRYVYMINFQHWGEPLLAKHVAQLIEYAHRNRIGTAVASNGNYPTKLNTQLVESGLDHITVAVDGTNQEIYEQYRVGGDLAAVKLNILDLIDTRERLRKRRPFVELQFLVFEHNKHQVAEVRRLAKDCRVDGLLIRAAVSPDNDANRRRFYTWNDEREFCRRFWYTAVINANLGITPCCNFFFERDDLGNLREESFLDVWNGPVYTKYRRAVSSRDFQSLHANCLACKKYNGPLGCREYGVRNDTSSLPILS